MLGELVEATGWLPHTTRAALTGLRKKGLTLDRAKRPTEAPPIGSIRRKP
jgi:hypothetical protein